MDFLFFGLKGFEVRFKNVIVFGSKSKLVGDVWNFVLKRGFFGGEFLDLIFEGVFVSRLVGLVCVVLSL